MENIFRYGALDNAPNILQFDEVAIFGKLLTPNNFKSEVTDPFPKGERMKLPRKIKKRLIKALGRESYKKLFK